MGRQRSYVSSVRGLQLLGLANTLRDGEREARHLFGAWVGGSGGVQNFVETKWMRSALV